jgi:cation diffusion facilitator family transporter
MAASLLISFLMLGGKLTAYFITGSAAIFSDAIESVVHLFATGFAGFSLWYAVRPPDPGHPYGHGKIAYFSAGFEGGLILIAALSILYSATLALIRGPELRQLNVGLWIIAGLTAVNLALGLSLVYVGRKHNSLVLVSNGQHVLTDMWTSLGVVVGVGLVEVTGFVWLDPVVAIIVALNILWTAFRLVRRSVAGLMEAADPADTQAILEALDEAVRDGLISGYHQVRHRRVNDQLWIECHLLFPETMSITEAHRRSHTVEDNLARRFADGEIVFTAHLEPESHETGLPGGHIEPVDPLRSEHGG